MEEKYIKTIYISVVLVAIIVIGLFTLHIANISLVASGLEIATFWISFCIGMAGAGVFLLIILMTEKNLDVLVNQVIPNIFIMSLLYLISGGFVAAVTQISTGLVVSSSIHAIFLIGFGWQGAITGVAGTGTRVNLAEKVNDKTTDAKRAEDKTEIVIARLTKTIKKLEERLKKYEE